MRFIENTMRFVKVDFCKIVQNKVKRIFVKKTICFVENAMCFVEVEFCKNFIKIFSNMIKT